MPEITTYVSSLTQGLQEVHFIFVIFFTEFTCYFIIALYKVIYLLVK